MTTPDEMEPAIIADIKELFTTQDEKKLMKIYSYYNEYSLQCEPNNLLLGNLRFIGIDYTSEIPLLGFLLQSGSVIKREISDNGLIYECIKELDYGNYINQLKI